MQTSLSSEQNKVRQSCLLSSRTRSVEPSPAVRSVSRYCQTVQTITENSLLPVAFRSQLTVLLQFLTQFLFYTHFITIVMPPGPVSCIGGTKYPHCIVLYCIAWGQRSRSLGSIAICRYGSCSCRRVLAALWATVVGRVGQLRQVVSSKQRVGDLF